MQFTAEPDVTQRYMARDTGPNVVLTSIGTGWRIPCVFTMIEFLDITGVESAKLPRDLRI
jgi:hypothetical protein